LTDQRFTSNWLDMSTYFVHHAIPWCFYV